MARDERVVDLLDDGEQKLLTEASRLAGVGMTEGVNARC